MEDLRLEFESYKKNIDDIVREGKDINFADIRNELEIAIDFFLTYYSDKKYQARFTEDERQDIQNYCYGPISSSIIRILNTSNWQSASPDTYRNSIRQGYNRLLQQNYLSRIEAARASNTATLEEFAARSKELIAEQMASLEAAKNTATETFANLEAQKVDIDKKIKQIDAKAERAAKSLAKQISSQNGKVFKTESDNYKAIAKRWLIALIFIITVAAALLTWLFIDVSSDPGAFSSNIVFSGLKVTAVLILVYLIQIATRNYNANKHLETINRQRATIVSFVNDFVNSVDGEEYKDYLLTYAAKTVFDHGETGFISRNYGAGSNGDDGLDAILNNITKFK